MNIEITKARTLPCWVVHLDDLAVNFNSLEQANAFVAQLNVRIAAPHVWPHAGPREIFERTLAPRQVAAAFK
ncbi:hypothetical protein [Pseudomonas costantinii]|uniref:Uncharacterized protein n=1 Tax=Pseudomonas costantinii TaxID=168469 RepID=A0A1S2V303_9PSED|nr:hypothetical protein [Pseudomonas costantinii]OIN53152.1 hypothetical protein BFL40_11995 [Pseudomonas costantinii]SED21402.1 hypothetical protein SAMN04515675_0286 [Pseudomonas costantinii]